MSWLSKLQILLSLWSNGCQVCVRTQVRQYNLRSPEASAIVRPTDITFRDRLQSNTMSVVLSHERVSMLWKNFHAFLGTAFIMPHLILTRRDANDGEYAFSNIHKLGRVFLIPSSCSAIGMPQTCKRLYKAIVRARIFRKVFS